MERNIPPNISDYEIDAQFGSDDEWFDEKEESLGVELDDLEEIEQKNIEKKYYE